MFCENCGRRLRENDKFCPDCGNEVKRKEWRTQNGEYLQKNDRQFARVKPQEGRKKRGWAWILGSAAVLAAALGVLGTARHPVNPGAEKGQGGEIAENDGDAAREKNPGTGVSEQEETEQFLALVSRMVEGEEKYGYINKKGEEVIPAKYDDAWDFQENGLARVGEQIGENEYGNPTYIHGYINEKGEEVIPIKYDRANDFEENGLALVGKQTGEDEDGEPVYKYGYINEKGEEVIRLKYDDIIYYLTDIPYYGADSITLGLLDDFENDGTFYNGLALVGKQTGKDEDGYPVYSYGYINEKGAEVIPLKYKTASHFSDNGLAAVGKQTGEDEDGEPIYAYGYINKKGTEVIPLKYGDAGFFSENGLAVVGKQVGENEDGYPVYAYGYIDERGTEVISLKYDRAMMFCDNGLASVGKQVGEDEDGYPIYAFGYIDEKGTEVTPLKYDTAMPFYKNGLAVVGKRKQTGKDADDYLYERGCIDTYGNEVIPLEFSDIDISENDEWLLMATKTGEDQDGADLYRYEYYDSSGQRKLILPDTYRQASAFRKIVKGKSG